MKSLLSVLILIGFTVTTWATQEKATDAADMLQIHVQKICPVSGETLGSMGSPFKTKMGGQDVFLCCKGCIGKQANAEHWKTIQANLAKAQGTCPIMGKPVTANKKSTIVNGQQIFVCCPPCIKKIQADPAAAQAKVNASYTAFVAADAQAHAQHLRIAAQAICPVTGKKLGSMGDPIKVATADGEEMFLCCEACHGKPSNPEHSQTIQANLMKAQGVCPVTNEELPAAAQSTVVDGRRVFVCCPECIEKINADKSTYLAKVNELYAKSSQASHGEHLDHENHSAGQHKQDK